MTIKDIFQKTEQKVYLQDSKTGSKITINKHLVSDYPGDTDIQDVILRDDVMILVVDQSAATLKHWKTKYGCY